jgi:multisubunit Na+/H+ antiporter MnhC subunit
MKRIFSNPVFALAAGFCLRLFFLLKFPADSGDTVLYEEIATNWLKHHVYAMNVNGTLIPVDLRMPGYPAVLAAIYALTGRSGEPARLWVMLAQIVIDLATCALVAWLAMVLASLWISPRRTRRIFVAGLWLAALCPFTANYVAVPLTEVWATFFTTASLAVLLLIALRVRGYQSANTPLKIANWDYWKLVALGGFIVGIGTLFRPESPLLLITTCFLLGCWLLRQGEFKRFVLTTALLGCACLLPLVPWMIRNARTFHEFQPLAPKDAILPTEIDPRGFMAWEKTWLYRVKDCYLVSWKLNDEAIRLEDIPANAFDSEEEKRRVAEVLEKYNDEINWTADEDAVFAQIAKERTARHPLRTYIWIPLQRSVRIWFTPRIELLPVSGNVFPLGLMWDEDPVDQSVTVLFFVLNIAYVGLALWGACRLWSYTGARAAVVLLLFYVVVRTAFLTTLETPEPRYVLVCYPVLLALAAQVIAGRKEIAPDWAERGNLV